MLISITAQFFKIVTLKLNICQFKVTTASLKIKVSIVALNRQ